MTIHAYAARAPRGALSPFDYEPRPLGPFDIEVRISHCGICHSDVHLVDDDWKVSAYPLVPGHEIIGNVTALGSAVTHLKKGERVGIGWQRSSCMECEFCIRGDENFCAENEAVCVGQHGGFADAIRVDGRFAFRIPDGLSSENAAPLLCGGITVYSPLRHWGVDATSRVGIVGIGGLGHLAVQFAARLGAEVTAFSSTPDKETEARRFGAHHFISSTDRGAMGAAAGSLDFILSTVNVSLDWGSYLDLLRPDGKLCFVGVPPEPLNVPLIKLLGGRRSVCASPIGGRPRIREMLEFAARHGVAAQTETLPISEVNRALDKVRRNKARYRMVLAAAAPK